MYLELVGFYTDAQQSVVDKEAEQKNVGLTRGVDQFMVYTEQALDGRDGKPNPATAPCAYAQFKNWATAGALTGEPPKYNRGGTIRRAQYIVGLNILALKFKAAGFAIDAKILGWLRALNVKNIDFYSRATNRGNLYVWSGAAAALFAVLDRDPKALSYQDQVWRDTIAAIRDDGAIDGEMARAHRALIYHMYSLSATLVLQTAREALAYGVSPAEGTRVKLLADRIGRWLCDPKGLEALAQAVQEIPGDWAYRAPLGFGREMLSTDWSRCGRPNASLSDPTFGGDTRLSASAIRQVVP